MTHIHDQILPAGTQIGVYEIKDAAKISAFDITYRAWNHHMKERVRIREYFPHDFAIRSSNGLGVEPKSPSDKENFEYGLKVFLDQAEILTQIEHPNIVAAENILPFNGTAYLIMGTREGTPLSKLTESQAAFAEAELKFILTSILNALQKIHEQKIVHGGIQPATILIGKDGEPLLINFAAARLAIAARTPQLVDELATGYAPLEQYESAHEPGPATDFYALGATMYICMTHHQPVAAQSRILALNQGEPDPMTLSAEFTDIVYSAELLQAVQWMLQPAYNDRPQSATEILALLKTEHTNDQTGSSISRQAAVEVPAAKNTLLIGVMIGIVAVVTIGLWFDEKPAELLNDKPGTVDSQPLFQRNPGKTAVAIEPDAQKQQSVAAVIAEPGQVSGVDGISETIQETLHAVEQQADSASVPPIIEPALQDKMPAEPKPDSSQQLARVEQQPIQYQQPNSPEKQIDIGSIRKHLAAAEKAMKAERLTTPLQDNAHKYYQMVLAMEPDNAQARVGLQKIADRYVQFIGKAKTEGRINDAKLYLQRAEAVLPDDPKLQSIRAELAAAK